jgi:hypothetical protein
MLRPCDRECHLILLAANRRHGESNRNQPRLGILHESQAFRRITRWNALLRYLADGRLEMTNNAAKRGMRAPVLGRKNYLFCGSDAGGHRAACVYTIVESAKMCGINPQAYLADVLERVADHPINKIDAMLPWLWTQ